jgi:5-formyltetrahydrofolate cyclo-ligase
MKGPETLAERKAAIRRAALARRDAMGKAESAAASAAIVERALPVILAAVAHGFHPVSAFLPIRSEPDLTPLLDRLHASSISLALPRVTPQGLAFHAWAPGEALVKGPMNISEPPATAPNTFPALILTPLAAFDRAGARLGYGRGHYDEALVRLAARQAIHAIGIAFSCQEEPALPQEAHDRRMQTIITEREVIGTESFNFRA